MAKPENIFPRISLCCLAVPVFSFLVLAMSQNEDMYLYARRRNGFSAAGFVDPPKNQWGAMYYHGFGTEPEVEVTLANETKKEVTIQLTTPNLVTPVFVETPGEEWKGRLQFKQLHDRPILKSGEQRIPLDTTTVTLKPDDMVTLAFRIVTESGEELPPGNYEIEIRCNVIGLAGITREWKFQNRLGFEIRVPKTLEERISFFSLKAQQCSDKKDYAAAEDVLNQSLQLYPFDSDAYVFLAAIREKQGRLAEAIKFQQKAVELIETRKDYLNTKNMSNASIEEGLKRMKESVKTLRVKMASQQQKP
jgi:tetratricopeptide (TPR) repeat protein